MHEIMEIAVKGCTTYLDGDDVEWHWYCITELCSAMLLLLCELHWLKVPERVRFWLCVLTYRCLKGTVPHYLAETIRPVSSHGTRQHLWSAETSTLLVPSACSSTLGDRSFPVAAARAWNTLPQHVRNAPSLSIFRQELKSVLFQSSFPDANWQCTVLYLHARRSVLICHHVLAATNWFY